MINAGWKVYFGLQNNCKSTNIWLLDKNKLLFENLVLPIILYRCEFCGYNISRESWRRIEKIHKHFITYDLKIKNNALYPILLLEIGLFALIAWL